MKYSYHYYAIHQPQPGAIAHTDGFVRMPRQIITGVDYDELKQSIADRQNIESEKLTICSLTLVGTTEADP